jgi:hypothetical protein
VGVFLFFYRDTRFGDVIVGFAAKLHSQDKVQLLWLMMHDDGLGVGVGREDVVGLFSVSTETGGWDSAPVIERLVG